MSELLQVLRAFENPSPAGQVAARLGWSEKSLQGVLRQLEARSLISAAEPGLGDCATGCGFCSMQSFCPRSEQDTSSVTNKAVVWRLTSLGKTTLGQANNPTGQIGRTG